MLETLEAAMALRVARTLAHLAASLSRAGVSALPAEFERCARRMCELVDADGVSICVIENGSLLAHAYWYAQHGWMRPPLALDLTRAVWLSQQLHGDVLILRLGAMPPEAAFERDQLAARDTATLAAVPLVSGDGTVLGAVVAERYAGERPFTGECASILEPFADLIAAAFERMAYERAREAKLRDAEDAGSQSRMLWHRFLDELHVPVTLIQGRAQLLREETPLSPLVHQLLTPIDLVIDTLHAGLMLGELQRGEMRPTLRRLDVAALLREAVERAQPRALALQIELRVELPDAPLIVFGDRDRLGRLTGALIASALSAHSRGQALTVVTREREDDYDIELHGALAMTQGATLLCRMSERPRVDVNIGELVTKLGIWLALASHLARLHGGVTSFEEAADGAYCLRASMRKSPEATGSVRPPDYTRVLE